MAVMVVANTNNSSFVNTNNRRRHSISTSVLLSKPAFALTMTDHYTPLQRLPLAPPSASMRHALPMPTPSSSSAASPTARKMAAELRRHSFRIASTSKTPSPFTSPSTSPSTTALSPVKVLITACANAQIQRSRTASTATHKPAPHIRPSSSTSSVSSASRDLPILRFSYVARDVRVAIGSSWRLQRFELKSLRLQTGATPTLFVFSTANKTHPSQHQPESFALPADTTCVIQNGNGLKLKSRLDNQLRVRVRFTTSADALIWSRLIQDALDHAQWLRDHDEVQCLKQDAMSRVVVMRHTLTTQERVVKVLSNVRLDGDGDCEEVRILKKLLPLATSQCDANPLHFLSEYRVVETQHDVHIVMPKHAGKTLLQCLSARARPHQVLHEREARHMIHRMCETLQTLHHNDVVHCDLKLENVVLSDDARELCVIDFGGAYDLAQPNDQPQSHRKMVGTPGYIAPERVLSTDDAPTPAADLFSLGIILYQVLVGEHPFAKAQAARRRLTIEDSLSLDWTHMQRRLENRNVSVEAQQLVAQLVEADPRKRIPLDHVLHHAWLTNQ